MKMVVNLSRGQGLGNQLWLIYAAIGLSEKYTDCSPIIAGYKNFKGRDLFDFQSHVLTEKDTIHGLARLEPIKRYCLLTGLDYSEFNYELFLDYTKANADIELSGHMQYPSLLPEDCHFFLKSEFLDLNLVDEIVYHVRGGDYLKTNVCVGGMYYDLATQKLETEYGIIPKRVICDDWAFASSIFPDNITNRINLISRDKLTADHHLGGNIAEDFRSIFQAKYNIIPASTFSFWPAYLAKEIFGGKKIVIAPGGWFANRFENFNYCPPSSEDFPFEFQVWSSRVIPSYFVNFQFHPKIRRIMNIALNMGHKL